MKKLLFLTLTVALLGVGCTTSQRLSAQCQDFGKSVIEQHKDLFDNPNSKISFFYSKRLDTCVEKEIDELGNEWFLCDIRRNYIKQDFGDPSICGMLFLCDKDGVDNVILEKAEQYGGNLFKVSYKDFLDNGEGGEPRAIKTLEKEYTREQCRYFFNKKLNEIK